MIKTEFILKMNTKKKKKNTAVVFLSTDVRAQVFVSLIINDARWTREMRSESRSFDSVNRTIRRRRAVVRPCGISIKNQPAKRLARGGGT